MYTCGMIMQTSITVRVVFFFYSFREHSILFEQMNNIKKNVIKLNDNIVDVTI